MKPLNSAWIGGIFLSFVGLCHLVAGENALSAIISNQALFKKYYWAALAGNTPQLIQLRGFTAQNHTVVTPDGYVIQLFRVVNPTRHLADGSRHGYPIILFQGLTMASEAFLDNADGIFSPAANVYTEFEDNFQRQLHISCPAMVQPNQSGRSLAFTLATCGYDVWLPSHRDALRYSRHLVFDQNRDAEFYDVTLDSYSIDAKTVIDYVLKESNSPTTAAVCHSNGCNTVFQLLADNPPYNDLLKPFFNLGPYVYTQHTGSPLLSFPAVIEPLLKNLFMTTPELRTIQPVICDIIRNNKLAEGVYLAVYSLIGGFVANELDWERVYRFPAHFPATVAYRVLAHIGQRRVANDLFKFNYGPDGNMKRYGQPNPPVYDMRKVTSRYIVLFRGTQDFLADYMDLQRLKKTISAPLYREIVDPVSHTDFVVGRRVNVTTNLHILSILHELKLNYN